MPASAVTVRTAVYEFAHGHSPRGEGNWAFYFNGESEPRWFNGFYSQARRDAVRQAASEGVTTVTVGS